MGSACRGPTPAGPVITFIIVIPGLPVPDSRLLKAKTL